MNTTGRLGTMAALVSMLALGAASAQTTQNQQNSPKQNQSQDDATTGVSTPPPDSSIQATEIQPPPQPAPPPPAKPSAAIPAAQPAPASPAPVAAPASTTQSQDDSDEDIVTTAPAANDAAGATNSTSDSQNPDYGIVTSAPPATPALQPGQYNPNNDIVNFVPVDPNALAEGTNITVRLSQDLSTTGTQRGETFRATVAQNVYNGSTLVIPAGAEMRGRVVFVSQGHHIGPHATLRLRPDVIILPDGTAYHLYADVIASDAPGTRVNDEGGIEASHHYKKDAVEYGSGAGVGAIAGGEIAGPVGAGVGSVVGAGLVTTHMLVQAPQAANLPQGSVLVFTLTEPMPLTPAKN